MTPQDVQGPVITTETLSPWLAAIVPPADPVRTIAPARPPAQASCEPLRPAA